MNATFTFGLFICGLLFCAFKGAYQTPKDQQPLETFKWQKRVLILFLPSASHPDGTAEIGLLREVPQELAERDLEVLIFVGNKTGNSKMKPTDGAVLRRQFEIDPAKFTMVLIGKDGGEKYRTSKVENPAVIFKIIDAMPMRQSEMNRQRSN